MRSHPRRAAGRGYQPPSLPPLLTTADRRPDRSVVASAPQPGAYQEASRLLASIVTAPH